MRWRGRRSSAWTRIIPKEAERSTYLLFASVALVVVRQLWLQEHDLVAEHPEYARYKKRVPMLLPFLKG